LHKKQTLTVTGPYAYTRNPLYLGSAVLSAGVGIATDSWIAAALLLIYFAAFYSIVMRREEGELRRFHATAFEAYAKSVPLFFPRFGAAKVSSDDFGSPGAFSFTQYRKNHEWQAAVGFAFILAVLLILLRVRLH
jgi:Phospholipid methyltransferase